MGSPTLRISSWWERELVGSANLQDLFPVGKGTGEQSNLRRSVPGGKENWWVART